MPPSKDQPWMESDEPCELWGSDDRVVSSIWFRSKPIDRNFCYRVAQLQLCTTSKDQGWVEDGSKGSWSWFEIVILPDEKSEIPRTNEDGEELAWRSHNNRLATQNETTHFGVVFDRRSELLAHLQIGDVIGVRVCVRFPGWENNAQSGYITARVLEEDLLTPEKWTMTSDVRPSLASNVQDGFYSFISNTACFVKSDDNELHSKIWFTTPPMDQATINGLESIQLFTRSRYQSSLQLVSEGQCFSWFDLVILANANDTVPRTEKGISLVWRSHSNQSNGVNPFVIQGQLFDEQDTEQPRAQELVHIKGSLKPNDVIGVRVNAQFHGWENYAEFGQLVVGIRNDSLDPQPLIIPDLEQSNSIYRELSERITQFYTEASPNNMPYRSAATAALLGETRADLVIGTSDSPPPYQGRQLRLLSLDGGGVRGVSSLRTLKKIMKKIAEIEGYTGELKPCEYFDMMAGTSTGGLIALMLGRLEMSIEDCENAYRDISEKVFSKKGVLINTPAKAFAAGTYMYEAQPLVDSIKDVVKTYIGDPDAKLLDPKGKCQVLVMCALASEISDGNAAVHLRNYEPGITVPAEYQDWTIWEAARATSAAPAYFDRFYKNGKAFVDGGLGFNNPVLELVSDMAAVHGKDSVITCLVSLGTGIPPSLKIGTGIGSVEDFINVATNSERAHLQIERFAVNLPLNGVEKYWRFNLSKLLSEQDEVIKRYKTWWQKRFGGETVEKLHYEDIMVKMDDWESLGFIQELTDMWLKRDLTETLLGSCAKRLSKKL